MGIYNTYKDFWNDNFARGSDADICVLMYHVTQDSDEDDGEEELKQADEPRKGLCETTGNHFEEESRGRFEVNGIFSCEFFFFGRRREKKREEREERERRERGEILRVLIPFPDAPQYVMVSFNYLLVRSRQATPHVMIASCCSSSSTAVGRKQEICIRDLNNRLPHAKAPPPINRTQHGTSESKAKKA